MSSHRFSPVVKAVVFILFCVSVHGQGNPENVSKIVELRFITPQQVIQSLSLAKDNSGCYLYSSGQIPIQIRINESTNQVLATGPEAGVQEFERILGLFDAAPRQIVIEAKIVEIDDEKSKQTGFDWNYLMGKIDIGRFQANWDWVHNGNPNSDNYTNERKSATISNELSLNLGDFLKLVQESGAGKVTNVPHIVTTNNQKGVIFDGSKVRYVASISSYANIFQTDEVTAGLMLSVVPSLGKSGYLNLAVSAKYSTLTIDRVASSYGTPIETGQSLENTVIVRDGESLLLGGFSRTEMLKRKNKIPGLGFILPFLFSRDVAYEVKKHIFIILTPKVIDLSVPAIPEQAITP